MVVLPTRVANRPSQRTAGSISTRRLSQASASLSLPEARRGRCRDRLRPSMTLKRLTAERVAITLAAVSVAIAAISVFIYLKQKKRRRRDGYVAVVETANEGGDEETEACGAVSVSPCCSSELEKKPQYRFKRVLADNSFTPFRHFKPEGRENETSLKQHPYKREITALLDNPPALPPFVTHSKCPEMGPSYEWVDTEEKLTELAQILRGVKAFAVDTEQHSVRSFLGFTALMQISTGKEDFLVDTIALHDVMGLLRPIFSDSSICKVFHGADNDVIWLQRDFHIYVVNLFDTAKACGVLSKKQKSLAYLLETYCRVTTNKSLQREDWRIRPLPEEMVHYARADAHYLLFIAYCLYLELDNQGLVNNGDAFNETYRRSNVVCLQLYSKEIELPPGNSAAASICSRFSNIQGNSHWLNDEKREIIRRLCTWRDIMARIHDESLRYVLPDQAIVALSAEAPTSPKEIVDVILQANFDKEFSNLPSIPPSSVIKGHIDDISCLLGEISEDADGAFQRIFRRQFDQMKSYQLSIYNYAILFELNIKLTDTSFLKNNGDKFDVPTSRKASRQLFVQKFSCKTPVYHNCRIYANDGRLLCYCDQRKLEWYLRRDLAKIVEEDPPAIMLLFEPKGRPEDEDNEFYIQSKKNICVGCGEKNHYLRYRIIPSCYRIHFPEYLKSHRSHDIVLLCVDCHEVAHAAAERYKRQVAAEFGIPLFVKKVVESSKKEVLITSDTIGHEIGVSPLQLRTAAMALLRHGSKMPEKRHKELIEIVKAYFGGREITEADLETALLVGMSPLERRKLEKKRGMTFKSRKEVYTHRQINFSLEETFENHVDLSASDILDNSNDNSCEFQNITKANEPCDIKKMPVSLNSDICSSSGPNVDANDNIIDGSMVHKQNNCVAEIAEYSEVMSARYSFSKENDDFVPHENESSNPESFFPTTEDIPVREEMNASTCSHYLETFNKTVRVDICEDKGLRDQDVVSLSANMTTSSTYAKKLSLLGHGPHGKQVVEHILTEQGENGILQFCQRWRQVFVDSVCPRFLPGGWDIKHSGRREFGKYSVYNPANKVTDAEKEEKNQSAFPVEVHDLATDTVYPADYAVEFIDFVG